MKQLILTSLILFSALDAQCQTQDLLPENTFTSGIEGPATDKHGAVYVVNYLKEGTIGKVLPEGHSSLFATLPSGSVGNSIRILSNGHLIVADYKGHNLISIDPLTQEQSIYAHCPEMNQPNDLAVSAKTGIIYASDPNWKNSTGKLWAIYRDGTCKLIEDNIGTTNGIELSPDNKTLYVNESIQRKLWKYKVKKNGDLSNKQLLYTFQGFGLDGMKCDNKGNIYVTRYDKGTVEVISPEGKFIQEYTLTGKQPSNLTFSPDQSLLYVTLQDRGTIEVIHLKQ
ncbi:MAG: SMP-30/gluconolactonase/LRE family protein [Bacteroidales bacterium]